jgi:hypothetical protein
MLISSASGSLQVRALFIPSYGALAAVGVLAALLLAQRTARTAG